MMPAMGNKRGQWEILSSKVVHQNPYYLVREHEVIKPDSSQGFYNVVEIGGAAFTVALDKDRQVYFVGMHKFTNDNYSIEVPGGGLGGEEPLVAAKRELREESGLVARHWKHLGITYPANGVVAEANHFFLATDVRMTADNEQQEEGITKVTKVPLSKAFRMIKDGEITDQQTITALTLAALELGLIFGE
jgi:8-oxo-dGTP pyrophosphatase MutT (NUDIX family)